MARKQKQPMAKYIGVLKMAMNGRVEEAQSKPIEAQDLAQAEEVLVTGLLAQRPLLVIGLMMGTCALEVQEQPNVMLN